MPYVYRLGADLLKNEFEHGGPLPHLLLRYPSLSSDHNHRTH